MVKLSERMLHLADMVRQGAVLADVGTDHGYIPIYLVESGRICRAFAMDIKEGPLGRAKEHIRAFGLDDYITVRRSDGVAALSPGEADTILIAGMGGDVMRHILEDGEAVVASSRELILQPQSKIREVREYLFKKGYEDAGEDMVYEEGKYYPMMRVLTCGGEAVRKRYAAYGEEKKQMFFCYGEFLIQEKHSVMRQFLKEQAGVYEGRLSRLDKMRQSDAAKCRRREVLSKLHCVQRALGLME